MAAKDVEVGARHVDVAPDRADFWTRGVGEAPQSPAGALSPRHSSGGLRHMLFSADERRGDSAPAGLCGASPTPRVQK